MPLEGEYEPGSWKFAADHVERYERSGGTEATTIRGMPVVVLTSRGRRTGKLRKSPLMRVEHEGAYAVVGSIGGAPRNPVWVYNLRANPDVTLQDGPEVHDMTAREVTGAEKAEWWKRATDAYPPYDEYQAKTERVIPVFVLEPRA
jgi:deazaflavin-dependent oxidoreductase (nitroreductase family)